MIISKRELNKNISYKIQKGAVFIYPTDTIYGMGCNALNAKSVIKIRQLKERYEKPFSIIAPSKRWIYTNCVINANAKKWLKKLPGPYTLILKVKNKKIIAREVTDGLDTVGIRIPKHWISSFVKKLGIPIVTTSVNKTTKPFMTTIENLDKDIKYNVNLIIYEGPKKGKPSTIVNLVETKVIKR